MTSINFPSPAISVLMPVYNTERYLDECVNSILNQTFRDFEFLIIDDGSTDGSRAILERYAAHDPRIRLVSRPNTGYVVALNEMLERASGRYIARMDADDVALPDRFRVQIEYLEAHPDAVCVGTSYELIDDRGRVLMAYHVDGLENDQVQEELLSGNVVLAHPTIMARADLVRDLGGYDESLMPAEDLDLWLRMGERGRLAVLPQTMVRYREHAGSVSSRSHELQVERMRLICSRAWERRGVIREFKNTGWRPTTRRQLQEKCLLYGWHAFHRGDRPLALELALKAACLRPGCSQGWRLLACSLLKPIPTRA
ncbi:MAG: glycosyltransferase [Isosphaeraceae bacterium]